MYKRKKHKKRDRQYQEEIKSRSYCECGHSITMPNKRERIMCDWCGSWIYKNEEVEFKNRTKRAINNLKMKLELKKEFKKDFD